MNPFFILLLLNIDGYLSAVVFLYVENVNLK